MNQSVKEKNILNKNLVRTKKNYCINNNFKLI